MNAKNITEEDRHARSRFIRELVQNPTISNTKPAISNSMIPRRIVQFWDNLDRLPEDVKECLNTWHQLEVQGIERLLFDNQQAKDFIRQKLGRRHLKAYERCYHPAMQSDYFRLSYIFVEGGCYIDADDVYTGAQIQHLFQDGRLKIQPLCYDTATNTMVSPPLFTKRRADSETWIFYFNNNPLISCSEHPIVEHALTQATLLLEREITNSLPEIQSTTGPGNLTKSIFDLISEDSEIKHSLYVLSNWEDIARSKWELSYRNDSRNWRHSNRKRFQVQPLA